MKQLNFKFINSEHNENSITSLLSKFFVKDSRSKLKNIDNKPYFDLLGYINFVNQNDISNILDLSKFPYFQGKIFLSALGARICYGKEDIKTLLKTDNRIINPQERSKFLRKLGFQFYHTSVFAHSFEYIKLFPERVNIYLHPFFFKSKILFNQETKALDEHLFGISLRHIIEISSNIPDTHPSKKLYNEYFNYIFESEKSIEKDKESLEKTYYYLFEKYKNFKYIRPIYIETNNDGWIVFAIENVSRILTHQLVRHTILNFSQRSQRYVDESKEDISISNTNTLQDYIENYIVIPPSLYNENNNSVLNEYCSLAYDTIEFYKNYKKENNKLKKEDLRFILPQGFKTTILVSGTLNDIKDWIEKRIIPQAQWEIRTVAEELNEFINTYQLL